MALLYIIGLVQLTIELRYRKKQSDDRSGAFYGQLERLVMHDLHADS